MFAAAVCGDARGDCVIHMRRPLPNLTIPLWYCARRPSRSGSVSHLPGHALHGPGRGTVCDCDAFAHGLMRLWVAFFRLVSLSHVGFIPMKAGVLLQDSCWRVANRFAIGNSTVLNLER